ncbi:MAG: PDZ domain-containing protein [Oscillospiraceae bacterium]|nr:PDZ domain-containing protein [Oscillospiraceae bacterium]
MRRVLQRMFGGVGIFISRLFSLGIPLWFVILVVLGSLFGTRILTRNQVINEVGGKDDYDEAMRYIEIKDIIDEKYIEQVDRKSMGYSAATAMVSGLGDAWSSFLTDDEYRTYQLSSSNEYSDIGMSLVKDSSGGFQIVTVYPDSPAARSGIVIGMVITAVDGERVSDYTTDEVRTLIRSKMSGKFNLSIVGMSDPLEIDATSVNSETITYRLEKTGAGYIQIHNFEAGSGQACIDAVEYLLSQGAVALVIDVRDNSGGLTTEAALFLDYLLPAGRLFSDISKDGTERVTESDSMSLELPMVVLINAGSFRESELFAAVLKDYHWATLIGEPTTGNTRTQETIVLHDGSALRLSTHSLLSPNGTDIAAVGGVVPDMIVFNRDASATGTTEGTTGGEEGTASTSDDTQLMEALRFLS